VTEAGGGDTIPATVRNLGTGVYEVVFTLTTVGTTQLAISLGGVPTTTLPVVVTHGPFSPLLSTVSSESSGTRPCTAPPLTRYRHVLVSFCLALGSWKEGGL
jgi:hypothetical protein